jgi:hypothetical protein
MATYRCSGIVLMHSSLMAPQICVQVERPIAHIALEASGVFAILMFSSLTTRAKCEVALDASE